jgi:hypothetical protein
LVAEHADELRAVVFDLVAEDVGRVAGAAVAEALRPKKRRPARG